MYLEFLPNDLTKLGMALGMLLGIALSLIPVMLWGENNYTIAFMIFCLVTGYVLGGWRFFLLTEKIKFNFCRKEWEKVADIITPEEYEYLCQHRDTKMIDDPLSCNENIIQNLCEKNLAYITPNFYGVDVPIFQHWVWYYLGELKQKKKIA